MRGKILGYDLLKQAARVGFSENCISMNRYQISAIKPNCKDDSYSTGS